MADWYIRFSNQGSDAIVGEYSLMQPEAEIRNSEVGRFSGELALSQFKRGTLSGIGRDEFAPYRSQFQLWRQSSGSGVCVTDGMLTSVNLNFNRDTVLIAGKDYKHYLQRRIYPFDPEDYKEYNDAVATGKWAFWDQWPKRWPRKLQITDPTPDPVPIKRIVRDLLLSMRTGVPVDPAVLPRPTQRADGVPDIVWNISDTGGTIGSYKVYPGDQTSIYDHIQKLSEMREGFEWDILHISLEFKLWMPTKYQGNSPVYHFNVVGLESDPPITEFDWTNDGPD